MSERLAKSISCDTCVAACCRAGTDIVLTHDEQGFMMGAGTGLGVILPAGVPGVQEVDWGARARKELAERSDRTPEQRIRLDRVSRVPENHGLYVLETDCGHLVDNRCSVYDDPRRPIICRLFEAGQPECRNMRIKHGVDPKPVTLQITRRSDKK